MKSQKAMLFYKMSILTTKILSTWKKVINLFLQVIIKEI